MDEIRYLDKTSATFFINKIKKSYDAINLIVNENIKNLINPKDAINYVGQTNYPIVKGGVTYSLNTSTGKITLSDTATSVSTLRIPITLPSGTYHVSGIPLGGSDSTYRADLRTPGGNVFITNDFDYGEGFTFTINEITSMDYCIRIANGYTPDNVVVAQMITPLIIHEMSPNFVKYRPSYDEIIQRLEALES